MEEEFRVKDVINLTLDRMKQEGIYFATKDDQGYASAKSLYKLDKDGLLEEKTIDKIVEEVISYLGDGAVYLVEAINQWIEDGLVEGKLGYIDNLNMEFDGNAIIEGNLEIYNGIGNDGLGIDTEPKEEEIAQEVKEEKKSKKEKKTESKKIEGYNWEDKSIYDFIKTDDENDEYYDMLVDTFDKMTDEFINDIESNLSNKGLVVKPILDTKNNNVKKALEVSSGNKSLTVYVYFDKENIVYEQPEVIISQTEKYSNGVEPLIIDGWIPDTYTADYKVKRVTSNNTSNKVSKSMTETTPDEVVDVIEKSFNKDSLDESKKVTESISDEDLEKEYGMGWAQLPMSYLDNLYDFVSEWYEDDPDGFEDTEPKDVLDYFREEYELDDEDIETYEEWYLTYAQHILNQVMKDKLGESKKITEGVWYNILLHGPSGKDVYDQVTSYREAQKAKKRGEQEYPDCEFSVCKMKDGVPIKESKKITEGKAKVYQLEATDANHGKLFARFSEVENVNLSDYKEVANIGVEDNLPDDEALEYIFTLGNTNQDLRDANPEMRSISVSDVVELNGKYYYCDAFGWKDISDKLTESRKVEESDNEDTLEVRTYFGIQILGSNFDGEDYLDNGEANEILDRYPEIEPDELFDIANKKIKGEDLAEYLPDDLKAVIHSIKLHFEYTELVAVIKADKSFYGNNKLKEELAEYLEGQYSDGWGEGFEQQPLLKITDIEDDQGKSVEADVYIQPMLRYDSVNISLTEKKTLKNSKEIGRKKVVEVITNLELGKDGLPRLPDPYEMQYRFQDDLYQIVNKGPEGIEGYCYAISDDDSYTGTWSIYGKSDEGIIDYEDNVEDYNECVKLLAKFDDVALQESKKLKSTLTESSDTSKRKRLNEENQKSADLISNALSAKDFDIESPAGQIIKRTSELFNALSDKQYDVQVTFDNGESQSAILLGNQGGKVIITITNGNEPLKAFASGNFELTEENFEILNDIKEQISVL